MALVLWRFWTYSFLGYLLEKAYAAAVSAEKQTRKNLLLLPLCPVYGLGALAALALPPGSVGSLPGWALWGALAATAVEYAVHWGYETLLGVRFWDYTGLPGNLRGRVCLPFSLAWWVLLLPLPGVDALLTLLLSAIPPPVTWAVLVLFTADALAAGRILHETGDTEALRWKNAEA